MAWCFKGFHSILLEDWTFFERERSGEEGGRKREMDEQHWRSGKELGGSSFRKKVKPKSNYENEKEYHNEWKPRWTSCSENL